MSAKQSMATLIPLFDSLTNVTLWSYEMNLARNSTTERYASAYPYGNERAIRDYLEALFNHSAACDQSHGSAYFQITVYMLYISIFVIALFGNGIVCYIVYASPRMKTVTNYFIANLAVGKCGRTNK